MYLIRLKTVINLNKIIYSEFIMNNIRKTESAKF